MHIRVCGIIHDNIQIHIIAIITQCNPVQTARVGSLLYVHDGRIHNMVGLGLLFALVC